MAQQVLENGYKVSLPIPKNEQARTERFIAIIELLLKEKLMLDPKHGRKGIAPLALIHDPHKHIHYGYALVGAEHEADLFRSKDHVLDRLEKAGFRSTNS